MAIVVTLATQGAAANAFVASVDRNVYAPLATLISGLVADSAGLNVNDATDSAQNAAFNNFLSTQKRAELDRLIKLRDEGKQLTEEESRLLIALTHLDQGSNMLLEGYHHGTLNDTEESMLFESLHDLQLAPDFRRRVISTTTSPRFLLQSRQARQTS